ncbi:MAG: T9SS type A sorting domain-containing protein [candidate division Zixibacteria bacterium]|nr:T9SS type A sorting domain-containing protein [candidate division Zixibacteria bacterium]
MKVPNKAMALVLCLLFLSGSVWAQTSANYILQVGGPVGGGGSAGSSGYNVTGDVPLSASGGSGSSNYTIVGGILGAAYRGAASFSAMYTGSDEETVNIAARTLKVAYSGGTGAVAGVFYYRLGGDESYSSAGMTAGTGDTMLYILPANSLTIRGLEYYFELTRNSIMVSLRHPIAPYVFITRFDNTVGKRPTAMPNAQYRIIGVPIGFSTRQSVDDVFLDDLGAADKKQWRLANYDNTTGTYLEYPDASIVTPTRGYWLIARGGKKYGAAGFSMRPNTSLPIPGGIGCYEVAVDSGWNLVANPFPFNISWADVRFKDNDVLQDGHPASVLDDFAYWYSGTAYSNVATIPAWDGFFVKINKRNIKILFPYRVSGITLIDKLFAGMPSAGGTAGAWDIQLQLAVGDRLDDCNFAGVRGDASTGPDVYDYSEPPPAPEGPMLAFRLPDGDKGLHRADYRAPFSDGATWDITMLPMPGRVLTPGGLGQIPEGMEAWLVLDNGAKYKLTEGDAIGIPDGVKSGRLLVGTEKYLDEEDSILIPYNYALFQNFPNPFNPSTSIRFALPKSGKVRLEVFNLLGQKVKTLIDGELEAGYHSVLWDGNDSHGKAAATGVYFYKMTAGAFSENRKMLLLK